MLQMVRLEQSELQNLLTPAVQKDSHVALPFTNLCLKIEKLAQVPKLGQFFACSKNWYGKVWEQVQTMGHLCYVLQVPCTFFRNQWQLQGSHSRSCLPFNVAERERLSWCLQPMQ